MNRAESNTGSSSSDENLRFYVGLFSVGLAAGTLMNAETALWYQQSVQAIQEQDQDRADPPKPPRRPNARIGGVALGHGF